MYPAKTGEQSHVGIISISLELFERKSTFDSYFYGYRCNLTVSEMSMKQLMRAVLRPSIAYPGNHSVRGERDLIGIVGQRQKMY